MSIGKAGNLRSHRGCTAPFEIPFEHDPGTIADVILVDFFDQLRQRR